MKIIILFITGFSFIYSQCDSNEDNTIDILDVIPMVDCILDDCFDGSQCDWNHDGLLNIFDLVSTINCILQPLGCLQDCEGVWGGNSEEDICGVCNGNETTCNYSVFNDWEYVKDRYFFIDQIFKNNYYPLTNTNSHTTDTNYVVHEFELYKKTNLIQSSTILGSAFLNPLDSTSYNIDGLWIKLVEQVDYVIDRELGWIRMNWWDGEALAIAYTINTTNLSDVQEYDTGTTFGSVYNECIEENEFNEDGWELCQNLIKLKLIKDTGESTSESPTWPLMFKNVYSLGQYNLQLPINVKIMHDMGGGELTEISEGGNSYLNVFGLDQLDVLDNHVEGGDGIIDYQPSFLNLLYGELFFPQYLPFAYDINCNPQNTNDNCLGIFNNNLDGLLTELDSSNNNPAMYYNTTDINSIFSQHQFKIYFIRNNE